MLTFYGYDKCGTCRKAKKWLGAHDIEYRAIDITEQPPSATMLRKILKGGDYSLRQLFNTSGEAYRALNIKQRLPEMTEREAVELLSQHGKLVKRPIVTDGERFTVGFDEQRFADTWG